MNLFLSILMADALRYLIPASGVWLLLTRIFPRWAEPRRLGRRPEAGQIWREVSWSFVTILIFALSGLCIAWLARAGVFEIYRDADRYGLMYLAFSLFAIFVLHEFYFYAVHRLLHRPWWFTHVHRWYHRSVHPTPWTAYAFHPVEAALMAVFLPGVLFLMPLHGSVIGIFLVVMIARNVIGHCGVELATSGPIGRLYARVLATTAHHHQHHQFGRGNYGLYFRFSDRLFGTERPDYAATIARYSHPGSTGVDSTTSHARREA